MEAFNALLTKIPVAMIAILFCGWLGYDYYDWLNSPQSELGQKKTSISISKTELESMKKKLAQGETFYKSLDEIKARIRQLSAQLDSTKAILSGDVDIANFVRLVTLEAKKLGISLRGIRPEGESKKEHYTEVAFAISFRGAYVQALVFFDRIAKFQQVIKVTDFTFAPTGSVITKYVELDGTAKLNVYRYLGTKADELGLKDELKQPSAPRPDTTKKGSGT